MKKKQTSNNQIIFVLYEDASYVLKNTKKIPDSQYIAMGRLIENQTKYVCISFLDSNEKSVKGLMIPHRALLKSKKTLSTKRFDKLVTGTQISVYWEDVTYFHNGIIPSTVPVVYTEGVFAGIQNSSLMISKPETLIISAGKKTRNHPEKIPYKYYIPLRLITEVNEYA